MKILLTFTGFHDPYSVSPATGEEVLGPALTVATGMPFDVVYLFSTVNTVDITQDTAKSLKAEKPNCDVRVKNLPVINPTDYLDIIRNVRREFTQISEEFVNVEYFIATASGTPQIHACWLLLSASGEIPACLLQTQPPRFVTADNPLIKQIDLTATEFPSIQSSVCQVEALDELSRDPAEVFQFLNLLGNSVPLQRSLDTTVLLAEGDEPVLINGETGSGKELFAQAVHHLSDRFEKGFVEINCSTIPANLAESTLFGHVKGSFTGAHENRTGLFEEADGGSLFLDEIAELPLDVQAKLLKVLEDGKVYPVGSSKAKNVDVRIIAATKENLLAKVDEGEFRDDLYYRLCNGHVEVPPLRVRKGDITQLAVHFMNQLNAKSRRKKSLSPEALQALMDYNWPGNIRELRNIISRSFRLSREDVITPDKLAVPNQSSISVSGLPALTEEFDLATYEKFTRKSLMAKALEQTSGNKSQAAKLLGVTPQHFYKMEREG